jgi:phenylacetate-CoA ligase
MSAIQTHSATGSTSTVNQPPERLEPNSHLWVPKPGVGGIAWPATPTGPEVMRIAVVHQLQQTQWWPPQALVEMQLRQLALLARHAAKTVPFYRDRLDPLSGIKGGELIPDIWRKLPLLTRSEIQDAGDNLISTELPPDHGRTFDIRTSGSTGRPVRVKGTSVTRILNSAFNLRNHLWHGRDFSASVGAIQTLSPTEAAAAKAEKPMPWGPASHKGKLYFRDIRTPVGKQLEWLERHDIDYLMTYPSNLHALVMRSKEIGTVLPKLRRVMTMAELLQPQQRAVCEQHWGVPVIDTYSCMETSTIALQCPGHSHYLVQAERLYVEVLDNRDRPCAPGEIGRILISDLHNFATPLIRYELGDYAEVGGPCPSGRGLPVLTRIRGRSRNMATLPSGDKVWPSIRAMHFVDIAPVRQFQLIQRDLGRIEVNLVVAEPLTKDQEEQLRRTLKERISPSFEFTFRQVEEIPRGPNGKYEDFRSELT